MDKGSFKSNIIMINYNGDLIASESAVLGVSNRAFQYGDGVFETIISKNGMIKFQNEHWDRIVQGVNVLKMDMPFSKDQFLEILLNLLGANDLLGQYARLKLYIWRAAGGLYTPTAVQSEYLLTAEGTNKKIMGSFHKVAVAQTVYLQKTAFSHLKTISALSYVLAGIEKEERKLDELILLNQQGFIAEASSSNIYFFDERQNTIYTPSLDSGCIDGVSRRFLLKHAARIGLDIQEILWKPEEVSDQLSVFTLNVAGVNRILKIGDRLMGDNEQLYERLEELFQW